MLGVFTVSTDKGLKKVRVEITDHYAINGVPEIGSSEEHEILAEIKKQLSTNDIRWYKLF